MSYMLFYKVDLLLSCHRLVIGPQLNANYQNGSSICLGKGNRRWVRLGGCLDNRNRKLNHKINPLDPNLDDLSMCNLFIFVAQNCNLYLFLCVIYLIEIFCMQIQNTCSFNTELTFPLTQVHPHGGNTDCIFCNYTTVFSSVHWKINNWITCKNQLWFTMK